LETEHNHKLLNLPELQPHFEAHHKTAWRHKVLGGKKMKGNHHHHLLPAKKLALTTPYSVADPICRDSKYPSGTCKEHV